MRFGSAFCLWKTVLAFCLGKTLPVSKPGCVLSQDLVAFCLEDFLRIVSRPAAFCLKTWLCFVSRPPAFCLKTSCVLSQALLRFVSRLTDFASWQQRIRFYCQGKENGVNILKSIDEGPYQMGTIREPLLKAQKEHPIWVQNDLESTLTWHIERNCTQPKRPHNSEYYKDKMLLMQAQENRDLALNVDNVFQTDDCDAFDSDVDEAPTAQTMFMANLSSVDPVTDETGPSYDSNILSEVQDHDHYHDVVCAHHEEHAMHDSVQLNHVVDSHADYTSNSNMIPYDQYVKDNEVPLVHSNVSSVPNDAYMMIYNDMYEPHAQSVSNTSQNTVVENSLTAELATYKEQVELENKYLEDFLDMKSLKEKVEDRLLKQNQSLQIVYMLSRPKPYYNELNKVAIGYKNPLCLTRAKQVQPTLYNGHEIIKDNHVPAIVYNTKDTLEIAEITRKK
uniref:Integrase, catalytic region, zinc finger, CCHC-type, peptidase aspartic, catalytic n=1 Tax=Tanacetum cinerariifolium TaxID=118510 RepID=A0A6L2JJM7_TANCI|nr:hypothetical protein [Tanacetum cinerariifolium]